VTTRPRDRDQAADRAATGAPNGAAKGQIGVAPSRDSGSPKFSHLPDQSARRRYHCDAVGRGLPNLAGRGVRWL